MRGGALGLRGRGWSGVGAAGLTAPPRRGPASPRRVKWEPVLEKLHLPFPLHLPPSPSLSRSDCPSVVPRFLEIVEEVLKQHRGLDPAHGEAT